MHCFPYPAPPVKVERGARFSSLPWPRPLFGSMRLGSVLVSVIALTGPPITAPVAHAGAASYAPFTVLSCVAYAPIHKRYATQDKLFHRDPLANALLAHS